MIDLASLELVEWRSPPCSIQTMRLGARGLSRPRFDRGRSWIASAPQATAGYDPLGLAGMVGLIVAIECWVARNWLDFSDPVSLSWRFSAEAAANQCARL